MKIAILTAEYPPYTSGGVGTLSYELSKGLAKYGIEVVVITRGIGLTRITNVDRLRIYYLASLPIPPKDVIYLTLRMRDVKKILNEEKPDAIHDLSIYTAFQPWITNTAPTVFSVQGSPQLGIIRRALDPSDNIRSVLFDITHRLQPMFMSMFKKPNIKAWVYVSRFAMVDSLMRIKEELRRKMLEKSFVVYNGVDIKTLRRIRDEEVKEGGVNEYSVVFISRLMEYKGVRFLVKAFRHVVNELRDAKLHIIGDGPIRNSIHQLIKKLSLERNVTMHGQLPRRDAMRVLAKSRILTHPSLYESFGLIVAEAYAMGKPVVTHKAGYAIELVEEPKAGLTVNVLNEREYANAMIELLMDNNLYSKLSQNASVFAEEKLSLDAMIKGYIDVYRYATEHA